MAAKLRPLSRAELQKRKAPKATGAEPSVKPGHSVRKFFVTAPTSKSISPQVKTRQIDTAGKEPPLWEVRLEVNGVVVEHLPGQSVAPRPRH